MFAQDNRAMALTTPLPKNKLIAAAFSGREAISELFQFRVEAMWQDSSPLVFDQLLGKAATVSILGSKGTRYFNGIVAAITQGAREELFTHYRVDIVPSVWTLTRNAQSRIFQQMSVPDILKKVLQGKDVDYQLRGTYEPREYCVQYRETDFAFASRLMEEEGIFYFFKHTDSANTMVLGDAPQVFQDLPFQPQVIYETMIGGPRDEDRITAWEKAQELRSGKTTLWDYTFQMPDKNCQTQQQIIEDVQVGTVGHKVKTGGNDGWELYDYPGGYAKRFDGIDKSAGDQSDKLQKIFSDNDRTSAIRMQQEAAHSLVIIGEGIHAGFTPGYKFQLQRHFSDNGEFTLLSVHHTARQPLQAASGKEPFSYESRFTCIPGAMPFRPARNTPVPFIHGVQTAVVVGPSGEEIFPDKYGRVKVQFPWDREGKKDANSSCWLRVATFWAGKQWGGVHIPRIGQEVIVGFLEGDPDQPIVVGSVYNADNMPPYTLPDNKTQSGIKSRSSKAGDSSNYNEIFFEDLKGSELIRIHAEKDQLSEVEHDETKTVGHDRTTTIQNDETKTVHGKETITIDGNQTIEIKQGNHSMTVDQGNHSLDVKMGNQDIKLDMGNQTTKADLGAISVEAMQSITLKVGQSKITIDQMGVTIEGMIIKVNAQIQYQEQALMVQSSASAMMQITGSITMIN